MRKKREPSIFDDNPFIEGLLDWMASPEGQAAGEVSDLVCAMLEHASVDARRARSSGQMGNGYRSSSRRSASKPSIRTWPAS